MTLTSGFFDSNNHDRLYNADQMSSIFDGVIEDGVYASIGEHFHIEAADGMTISVGSGRAWFNHTWTLNTTDFIIEIPQAEPVLKRVDTVVLEVNSEPAVRANRIFLNEGTPASNPMGSVPADKGAIHYHPLGEIFVKPGDTTSATMKITNLMGTDKCPYVTGPLTVVDMSDYVKNWQDEFDDFMAGTATIDPSKLVPITNTEIDGMFS